MRSANPVTIETLDGAVDDVVITNGTDTVALKGSKVLSQLRFEVKFAGTAAFTLTPASASFPNAVNIGGAVFAGGGLEIQGDLKQTDVYTTALLFGTKDNLDLGTPTKSVVRLFLSAPTTITGIANPTAGARVLLINTSPTYSVTLSHDVTSTAGNRFYLPNADTFTILKDACAEIYYDDASSRWRVLVADHPGKPVEADVFATYFGDGSDGDVIIDGTNNPSCAPLDANGVNVPERDLNCRNLTITGAGVLNIYQTRLYVSETLDVTTAAARSLNADGASYVSGPYARAGGYGISGKAGALGGITDGAAGGAVNMPWLQSGGRGGYSGAHDNSGSGGAGTNGYGGNGGRTDGAHDTKFVYPRQLNDTEQSSVATSEVEILVRELNAGQGGAGGGAGGGSSSGGVPVNGGSGGSGGGGGGRLEIWARILKWGSATATAAISAQGGNGSDGKDQSMPSAGGGGGGSGGGGGRVRLTALALDGPPVWDMIDASGGNGGNGGAYGPTYDRPGYGGRGGDGGSVTVQVINEGSTVVIVGDSPSGPTDRIGAAGGACKLNVNIIVPDLDTNVALHKSVSMVEGDVILRSSLLLDGSTLSNPYLYVAGSRATLEIDLGDVYRLDQVKVWRYWADLRTFHDTKTEVSADGVAWYVIYDAAVSGEYVETSAGKTNNFAARPVRYIRDSVSGSTVDTGNLWVEIQAFRRA